MTYHSVSSHFHNYELNNKGIVAYFGPQPYTFFKLLATNPALSDQFGGGWAEKTITSKEMAFRQHWPFVGGFLNKHLNVLSLSKLYKRVIDISLRDVYLRMKVDFFFEVVFC